MARRSGRGSAVTRDDVARYAGVSTAVVSFVVNGGPKPVSEATAARVRDAIQRLGYRPNSTARALALGRTKTLGLLVPDTTNPFYAEYALALQKAAAEGGYAVLMSSSGPGPGHELQSMLDLTDRQIDGLIVARSAAVGRLSDLSRQGVQTPVVVIDAAAPLPGHPTIGPDAAAGVAAAVDHLLEVHQHASVGLIIGDSVEPTIDGREAGWTTAHARHGRRLGSLQRAAFSRAGGLAAGRALLRQPEPPSAVITSSDLQAIGLLKAAEEFGVSVPDQLAVVSFDGTEETEYSQPALTTVRQPTGQMANAAVHRLLEQDETTHQVFGMELIIRRSCGCRAE